MYVASTQRAINKKKEYFQSEYHNSRVHVAVARRTRKTTQKWAAKSRGDASELHGVAEGGANFCLHTYEFPNVETFECEEVETLGGFS